MHPARFSCYCILLLLLHACKTKPRQPNAIQAVQDSVTSEINAIYKQGHFNGFAVALVNEQGLLYQHGFGYANAATGRLYTHHTVQNIASVSKTFIGIALLKAQELGMLHLDDPVDKYLPFRVRNPAYPAVPITIRQLATHTSGINDNDYYAQKAYYLVPGQDTVHLKQIFGDLQTFNNNSAAIPLADFLEQVLVPGKKWYAKNVYTHHKPGTVYNYSNIGASLAGYIVAQASGMPFETFTHTYILQPLHMVASGWNFLAVDTSQYSKLYLNRDTMLPWYGLVTYPDGNFITCTNDMYKYVTELVKGVSGRGTILKKESYAALFRPQLTAAQMPDRDAANPYGDTYNTGIFMGFSVAGNIGHTGGDPGVSSMLFIDPKTKTGRYLIINTSFSDKAGNDAFYAVWDVLGKYQSSLNK